MLPLAVWKGELVLPRELNLASKFLPLTESTYFIMLSLVEPRHGYGVMQYVSDLTRGGLRIGPGTLYGALATLEERKLIVPVERDDADCGGSRRKEYALTALGRQVLALELERQKALVRIGESILGKEAAISDELEMEV
jgi:DNA-binding PadR family transcriptional regulator